MIDLITELEQRIFDRAHPRYIVQQGTGNVLHELRTSQAEHEELVERALLAILRHLAGQSGVESR